MLDSDHETGNMSVAVELLAVGDSLTRTSLMNPYPEVETSRASSRENNTLTKVETCQSLLNY